MQMHIHASGHLKCGAIGNPYINKRIKPFCSRIGWSFPMSPTYFAMKYNSRKCIRCMKTSSQVVEKAGNKMDIKEELLELPVSSSYESAMEALSSLITQKKRGVPSSLHVNNDKLERMSMYLKILGLEKHLDGLNIIHVAGTKGKGSTCTFCEAILRNCGFRTGLFTSPHLINVTERFRIDGLEISEEKFLLYFWDCWNTLKKNATYSLPMPPLFQFLTALAFKIFVGEQVDVAIIEVGIGGKRDSTNAIQEPIVCGITSLGMDHMELLGNTLDKIAEHKAGIFKPRIPAFTAPQRSEAMDVLRQKALDLAIPLEVAEPLDQEKLDGLQLSLSGDHQYVNAGLAVSLCKCWLQRTGNWEKVVQKDHRNNGIPEAFRRGLSSANISGRAQIVLDTIPRSSNQADPMGHPMGDLLFYLDGAHSLESMEACGRWFSTAVKANKSSFPSCSSSLSSENVEEAPMNGNINKKDNSKKPGQVSKQVLLFNCMEVRDPQVLLPRLVDTCASLGTHFSKALFVPNMSVYNKVTSGVSAIPSDVHERDLTWQYKLQRLWEKMIRGMDTFADQSVKLDGPVMLPTPEFLYEDDSPHGTTHKRFPSSAVMPSLPLTINWLRDCARRNPSLKLEVLVTGSLHLVGDVLKLLRR